MKELLKTMPFDGQRLIYGGFAVLLDERADGKLGYVDGSLLAVPAANEAAYCKETAAHVAVLKEHGALRLVDAWEDDVPEGKVTDFKRALQAKGDEKVVCSWIEWPSKQARDQGWEKVIADPRMYSGETPYDNGRRIHGGFAPMFASEPRRS